MPNQLESQHRHLRAVRRTLTVQPNPRRPWRRWLLAATGLLLAGASLTWYLLRPAPAETVVLNTGTVELAVDVNAYVVRKEKLFTAPAAGIVQRLASDGQRVRVGSPVASILPEGAPAPAVRAAQPSPGGASLRLSIDEVSDAIYRTALAMNIARDNGQGAEVEKLQAELDRLAVRQMELAASLGRVAEVTPVAAPPASAPVVGGREVTVDVAGVLVFETDGLETLLSPARAPEWKPSDLRNLALEPRRTGESVQTGDPLLKVVDNLSISLVALLPEADMPQVSADGRLQLRFPGSERGAVAARIARRSHESGEVLLHLTAPVLPEELTHLRRVRTTLIFARFEGKIVPRTAVDVRSGIQGVWVLQGNREQFYPAKVLGGNLERVALETDLPEGARILAQAPTAMR